MFMTFHDTDGKKLSEIIAELFIKIDYEILENNYLKNNHLNSMNMVDFVIQDNCGFKKIVELKYYRPYSKPSDKLLLAALKSVSDNLEKFNGFKAILIFTIKINQNVLKGKYDESLIEIWDLSKLLELSTPYPDIYNRLLLQLELNRKIEPNLKINNYYEYTFKSLNLIEELETIQAGRIDAYKFESWCIKVIKYLFEEFLTGWHEQSETIDGLNRRDLVCRVIKHSESEVWELISNSLKSRYVVFEFKNYTDEITQREIITTERYLYPNALRNCAFIISRRGASESAKRVIEGAMREHGKLIISLNIVDIKKMLSGKDTGDDPNVYLFDKVDELLISLSR